MTLSVTFGGHDLTTSPYSPLAANARPYDLPPVRTVLQPYGGDAPGGVLGSRADDTRTWPLSLAITGTSQADLEANIAQLKRWTRPRRCRLVYSAQDGRYWIADCTKLTTQLRGPLLAYADLEFLCERPYQESTTPGAAVSTAALAATFDPNAAGTGINSYKGLILAARPLVYYRCGEATTATYAEDAANGVSAQYVGTFTLQQTGALTGDTDKAVLLDGISGYATAAGSLFGVGQNWSFECWVSRAAVGTTQTILHVMPGGGDYSGILITWNGANNVVVAEVTTGTVQTQSGGAIAGTGAYHHIVVTYAAGTCHLYVDGVDRTGAVTSRTFPSGMAYFQVGVQNTGGGLVNYLSGTVDEVAFYNYALTSTQAGDHYNIGTGATFTRHAVGISAAAAGDVSSPARALITGQSGTVAPNRIALANVTGGQRDGTQGRIVTPANIVAATAVLLDPRLGRVTKVPLSTVVGWWPLCDASGGPRDFSSNSRDLTANGSPTYVQDGPDDGPGRAGGDRPAVTLDGSAAYFSRASEAALNLVGDIVCGAWVYPTTTPTNKGVLGKAALNTGYALRVDGSGYPAFHIGTGSAIRTATGITVLASSVWYFLVGTFEVATGKVRIYVNGVLEAETTGGVITPGTTGNVLRVGGTVEPLAATVQYWQGRICDPFLLSTVITPTNVMNAWQYGSLAYAIGTADRFYEAFPEVDPLLAATNTLELSDWTTGSASTLRAALSYRSRYL